MKYPQLVSMPSAVSDWLEEQLEARGIDAVVYTRYVLSLLHRDTLDLVSTDQDIQLPKEARQSGRGRKRFRRSAEWWSHVRADVEQLRRSAAVECLMSASDQKCGIESLVDELCEKLKHFESSSSDCVESSENSSGNKVEKSVVSPNDLAKRYYAAFPPLNGKSGSANLITLIPQLYNSSNSIHKRKHGRKICQQNRSASRDKLQRKTETDNMKSRSGGGKPRFSYFSRAKRDFGFARSMEKSAERSDVLSDWDMYFVNGGHNRAGDEGYSTSDTTGVDESEDMCEMEHSNFGNKNKNIDDSHLADLVAKFDGRIEALWNTEEEACIEQNNENEYHDLPVDIAELLSSPTKQTAAAVEILNVANKRASQDKCKPFIQCGTNITSSIWSECADEESDKSLYDSINYCNLYNEALETSYPDKILGDQFNSLSMGADKISDDLFMSVPGADKTSVAENETNLLYENFSNENNNKLCFSSLKFGSLKQNDFTSLPWELAFPVSNFNSKKWSDAENYSYVGDSKFCSPLENVSFKRNLNKAVNDSLITLNHNKEASCFKEVVPKQVLGLPSFTMSAQNESNRFAEGPEPGSVKEEEDLLTSTRTHFRPIKQESTGASTNATGYADGTTFAIRSSLEHVNYRRSESGTLYLESGFDTPKKYMEYRLKNGEQPKCDTDSESCYSIEREFVLKFCVKQNEKCCQTELPAESEVTAHSPLEVPAKKRVLCDPEEFFFPGDEELLSDSVDGGTCECSCSRGRAKLATNLEPLFNASSETCSLHGTQPRPDSMAAEVGWGSSWKKCDKCNNNWSSVWPKAGDGWQPQQQPQQQRDLQAWQHIWSSSEELCRSCLGVPAGSGPPAGRSLEYFKLREELSEDGEQLLSDLSCLQRVYMEQLPSAEVSCDLSEPLACVEAVVAAPAGGSQERKRRHSSSQRAAEAPAAAVSRHSWTNASCLRAEQRCPFTPPLPLLRPVTL